MQKAKYKILVLLVLMTSVFTIDSYEFLHNHESGSDNHCTSCLLSSSLIAIDSEVTGIEGLKILPDFNLNLPVFSIHSEFTLSSVSDRAPPLS
ncbi:MAG TPA: hypothetical protein VIL99_11955 [Ignavibacteria bacterium]